MRNHEMNNTWPAEFNPSSYLCDPVAIVQLNCRQIPIKLQLLQPDCNLPPIVNSATRYNRRRIFLMVTAWPVPPWASKHEHNCHNTRLKMPAQKETAHNTFPFYLSHPELQLSSWIFILDTTRPLQGLDRKRRKGREALFSESVLNSARSVFILLSSLRAGAIISQDCTPPDRLAYRSLTSSR